MRIRALLVLLAGILAGSATARSQQPIPPAAARPSPVTFSETVAPIVYANCVTCHRPGEAAPFSLLSYEDVARRGALIAEVTASGYMPPWHAAEGWGEFVGERRLMPAQVAAIAEWVKQGMPRGDAAKMPRPPEFPADGWRLGTPDLVLEMPAGFDVPASGPDVYRNFVIPMQLGEDKWVRAVEYRPSARKAVHHALFAHVPAGSQSARDGADGRPGFAGVGAIGAVNNGGNSQGLGGWAVGATPAFLPEGIAQRLPQRSDFLLQLHFHPTGKPETEKSSIGIYFAEKAPGTDLFSVDLPAIFGLGAGIDIPPGEKQYTIRDSYTLPADVKVYSATAHAHYLATDMKAVASLPDGTTRRLLWIDDWDFNWQDSYVYEQPFVLPRGTRVDVTITYDNSADNPRNPVTPPRRALWGEESFDEMGTIGFAFTVPNAADVPAFRQSLAARSKETIQAGGKNGTLGRFLARQQRLRQGLQRLTIFDRQGNVVRSVGEPASYSQASFSPDGSRIAVIRTDTEGTQDVWSFDVETGAGTPVTADPSPDSAPVWSPDGSQIAFVSVRDNTPAIYRRASDGAGDEELLYRHTSGRAIVLTDWSADGRFVCFWSGDMMFLLPAIGGAATPVELSGADFAGRGGRLSRDGRLLAFNSNASGRFEIYVKGLDQPGISPAGSGAPAAVPRTQVSAGGVGGIMWRQDGRELFYLSLGPRQAVMAVDVEPGPSFKAGAPRLLFELQTPIGSPAQLSAVSSPDGQRFVFAVNVRRDPPR